MTKGETMTFANKFAASAGAVGLSLFAALPAWAQEAAPAAAAAVPTPDKGDTAWMITATVLVMAMIVPKRTISPSLRGNNTASPNTA